MGPEIHTITRIGRGFLAMMAKPVGEWLDDEIRGLRELDIRLVVSLLTPAEAHELGLSEEAAVCARHGLAFLSHPIIDRGVPDSVLAVQRTVDTICRAIEGGGGAVVHCRAGIGRSGVIAAAVLLRHGLAPAEAFSLITTQRRVRVPDTREQKQWVADHARELSSPDAPD